MALIRWDPSREVDSLQSEVNRLFNTFFQSPTANGNGVSRRWLPAMDLTETDDHLVLRADLPGMSEDDISIEVKDNVLTLSGERKHEREDKAEGYYRAERAFGAFERALTLPEGIDPDSVNAEFDRGVLEVRIPKPEERKPYRVQIGGRSIEGRGIEK